LAIWCDSIVPTVRLMLRIGRLDEHFFRALERWLCQLDEPVVERFLQAWSCVSQWNRATSAGTSGMAKILEKSRLSPSSARRPSSCRAGRYGQSIRSNDAPPAAPSTHALPRRRRRSSSPRARLALELAAQLRSCVATPTGQVFKWHLRIMMQPSTTSGAVAKPNSSAPRIAPTTTSRPVSSARPPAPRCAREAGLNQSLLRLGEAELHGVPACLIDDQAMRRCRRHGRRW